MKIQNILYTVIIPLVLISFTNFTSAEEPKSQYEQYIGEYKMNLFSARTLVVTVEEKQLMLEAVGQAKFALHHQQVDKFRIKGLPVTIEFVKRPDGQFDALTFNQQGKIMNFVKTKVLRSEYQNLATTLRKHGLSDAIMMNDITSAKILIDAGADLSELDTRTFIGGKNGRRPLNWASQYNYTNMIELLISAGADINQTNLSGYTPLHHAAENNAMASVKLLLSMGADVDKKTNDNHTALEVAAMNNHQNIVSFLQKKAQ